VAIVVVVTGGRSHGIPRTRHARQLRHVFELHPTDVPVQLVPVFWGVFFERCHGRPVGEIDVGQPVAIEIERRNPSCHGFDEMLTRGGTIFENEIQPAGSGHVSELDSGRRSRRSFGKKSVPQSERRNRNSQTR
jgi:hypothetical protein